MPANRVALLRGDFGDLDAAPHVGKRTRSEVIARIEKLQIDGQTPDIPSQEITALDALLGVRETLPFALAQLRDIAVDLPKINSALDAMETRIEALSAAGVTVEDIEFEASYGRTSMEYYDGFVFGFYARSRPDLPPLATGGRYDALTRRLGQGREIPAVGGVLRPDLMLLLEEGLAI